MNNDVSKMQNKKLTRFIENEDYTMTVLAQNEQSITAGNISEHAGKVS